MSDLREVVLRFTVSEVNEILLPMMAMAEKLPCSYKQFQALEQKIIQEGSAYLAQLARADQTEQPVDVAYTEVQPPFPTSE